MKKDSKNLIKSLAAIATTIIVPKAALADLTPKEAKAISEELFKMTENGGKRTLSQSEKELLKALGVPSSVCEGNYSNIDHSPITKEQLYIRLMAADPGVQNVSKKIVLEKQPVSTTDMGVVTATNSGRTEKVVDVSFSSGGSWISGKDVNTKFDQIEAYSNFTAMAREMSANHSLPSHIQHIRVNKLTLDDNTVSLEIVIQSSQGDISLSLKNRPYSSSDPAAQVVARTLIAAVAHYSLLADAELLAAEVNKLRYDAISLLRVSAKSDQREVAALIQDLDPISKSFFEKSASYNGRLFVQLINAKERLVAFMQKRMEAMAAEPETNTAADGTTTANTEKPKFEFKPRPDAARPLYRQSTAGNGQTGYYYPANTYNNQTMLWLLDPTFMMTHPWYWGISDQSSFSTFMMFNAIMDHNQYSGSNFVEAPAHAHDFANPVYPVLNDSNSQPIDLSQSNANADSWKNYVDPQTSQDLGFSNSNSESSVSTSGWRSSDTPSTTTTTGIEWNTTTTGDTTTTTTTTGIDWTTTTTTGVDLTTTTTTTTTGTDWTTTTTGTDWTTTTGDTTTTTTGDYTTTGDTTTTGSGSDW